MKNNELIYELDDVLDVLSKVDSKERIWEFLLDLMTDKEHIPNSNK